MRFLLTLHMPSHAGSLVHQIMCEYPADSLDELVDDLHQNDFIVVEEFYRNPQTGDHYSRGEIAINHRMIGKIKVINQQHGEN